MSRFHLEEATRVSDDHVFVVLGLRDDPETKKVWPHCFHLKYRVDLQQADPTLPAELTTALIVENLNALEPFDFTAALHTYFAVSDVEKVSIRHLHDLEYHDKVTLLKKTQKDSLVRLCEETDRVYYKYALSPMVAAGLIFARAFTLQKQHIGLRALSKYAKRIQAM